MDTRAWLAFLPMIGAFVCVWYMEPAIRRLVRMRWNAYWRQKQRERMYRGFAIRRNPFFRDATW